eukprot:3557816-Rhodomonas_salina.2
MVSISFAQQRHTQEVPAKRWSKFVSVKSRASSEVCGVSTGQKNQARTRVHVYLVPGRRVQPAALGLAADLLSRVLTSGN